MLVDGNAQRGQSRVVDPNDSRVQLNRERNAQDQEGGRMV